MTSEELRQLVEREIGADWDKTNLHGVDLRRCLLTPVKEAHEHLLEPGRSVELWTVLEEDPDERSGYKIVYDEVQGEFGLAISGESHPVFLGHYGKFFEALDAM